MTPNDIIPGQKYRNSAYPKNIYLGAQKDTYHYKSESPKILVIINGQSPGKIVHDPTSETQKFFWNRFRPIKTRKKNLWLTFRETVLG